MNLSYWEKQTWLSKVDFTIIGSGIVGLSCALHLRKKYPTSKILILEKGMLPQGASTKNAGFACFGSISEIIEDLKTSTEQDTLNLITKRFNGLLLLRKTLGDEAIDYKEYGGYELFLKTNQEQFEVCVSEIQKINNLLHNYFKKNVFQLKPNQFNYKGIVPQLIFNPIEGQLNPGKMMDALLKKVQREGIYILNNVTVKEAVENNDTVSVITDQFSLKCHKVFVATNGFAKNIIYANVKPARAQVLITKPIKNLNIKGTFHIDRGYYYFRNIDERILFGGGRELDLNAETTSEFGLTDKVQNRLEDLLRNTILPNTDFEIDHRWSGIMGIGNDKNPIVKQLSNNVYCGVKLGGMGVAIGSLVGKELAEMAYNGD